MSEATLEHFSDSVSSVAFDPNDSNRLVVGSWDAHVYLYDDLSSPSSATPRRVQLRGAVLDVCFGSDGAVYAGGLAQEAVRVDFEASALTTMAKHEDAVRCVEHLPSLGESALLTGMHVLTVTSRRPGDWIVGSIVHARLVRGQLKIGQIPTARQGLLDVALAVVPRRCPVITCHPDLLHRLTFSSPLVRLPVRTDRNKGKLAQVHDADDQVHA